MKKAVFWDFDGTIIYPNQSFFDAMTFALKTSGYEVEDGKIREFLYSACSWYHPEKDYLEHTGNTWWKCLFREFKTFFMKNHISENDWPKICKTFREYIWDSSHYKVYEDAVFCLTQCREKGYKNFILSNNFPELGRLIKDLGLNEFFSGCLISSNIGYEKPRIEIFQYAIKAAQQPDICYMIGDNPVADIFGGKRAGMHTILVHNQSKVLEADHKCSSLLEAIVLL